MVALGVSFLALLALALVPALLEQQEDALERELAVFSLARPMFQEIQNAHLQEMRLVERYVNSGDSSLITLYTDLVPQGARLLDSLGVVVSGMAPSYSVELSQVERGARDWRTLHSPLLEGPLSTIPYGLRCGPSKTY